MKRSLSLIAIVLTLSVGSRAATFIPDRLGNLAWNGVEWYEPKNPGYGVAFDYTGKPDWATLYVYDKGKLCQTEDAKAELESVTAAVRATIKQGDYKSVELAAPIDNPPAGWTLQTYTIVNKAGHTNYSIAAVTVRYGRFLKLRVSGTQKEHCTATFRTVLASFDTWGGQVDGKGNDLKWFYRSIDRFRELEDPSDSFGWDILHAGEAVGKSRQVEMKIPEGFRATAKEEEELLQLRRTVAAAYYLGEVEKALLGEKAKGGLPLAKETYRRLKVLNAKFSMPSLD